MTNKQLIENSTFFNVHEWGGDAHAERVNSAFLARVIAFRGWTGCPMLLTSVIRDGDTGFHGSGFAVDFIAFQPDKFKQRALGVIHAYQNACAFGFSGVGMYIDWKYTNKDGEVVKCAGIHIDDGVRRRNPTRWIRIGGEYYYFNTRSGMFEHNTRQISLQHIAEIYGLL